ncbi:MAG: tetratricopeptide repeat-containing serine protease family protein [Verrucomicrobiota bacterium]
MKANRLVFTLVLLLRSAVLQLPAQQSDEADRNRFEETKAKAEKGDAKALGQLGDAYLKGKGVKQDLEKAESLFLKVLETNSDEGEWRLSTLAKKYSDGDGVPKNSVKAIEIYKRLYEAGWQYGAAMLAKSYEEAVGIQENLKQAKHWKRIEFKRAKEAAEEGHADSQTIIAEYYSIGYGVPEDDHEAVRWLHLAAVQGHPAAYFNLGECYENGKGVPQDFIEAHKYYNLAASPSGPLKLFEFRYDKAVASARRNALARQMTPEQTAEAQRLAREFKPRNASESNGKGRSITQPAASGTGFFISDDGYLISNNHVVDGASQVRLVTSAGLISAKVVKVDAANDLALLKAEGRFAPLPLSPSRGVKLGGTVATVGFPNIGLQGFAPKLAKGEIAALSGAGDDARYFQISVPVQPGNSGGALVDERGNVVGVVSAKLNASATLAMSGTLPENVNYAVKSSYLLSFLESLPDVASKLKEPSAKEKKFEDVVKEAEQAAVLVLVY